MLGRLTLSTLLLASLATCGTSAKSPDASATHDTSSGGADALTGVQTVVCPATPDATISNVTGAFVATPGGTSIATISIGQIVQFTTTNSHDATPNSGVDPGIHVPFNQAAECKKFTTAGTFTFKCSIHGFMGSVVVQ